MIFIISIAFSLGFFIESMIGFGGMLIAAALLLFIMDIKTLILSTIFLSVASSVVILASDTSNISWKVIKKFMLFALAGIPIGVLLFDYLPNQVMVKSMAILLIAFGIRTAFFGDIKVHGVISKIFVFVSGIVHGLIGTGGPIAIIGMKSSFKNKSELRSSMAIFFIILNVIRMVQLGVMHQEFMIFFENTIVIIPLTIAIILGHKMHKKISERYFQKILSIFFIIAGFLLAFR